MTIINTKKLKRWVNRNIKKPIKGFEDKKHISGEYYDYRQQLKVTHLQISHITQDLLNRGKSLSYIINLLSHFKAT